MRGGSGGAGPGRLWLGGVAGGDGGRPRRWGPVSDGLGSGCRSPSGPHGEEEGTQGPSESVEGRRPVVPGTGIPERSGNLGDLPGEIGDSVLGVGPSVGARGHIPSALPWACSAGFPGDHRGGQRHGPRPHRCAWVPTRAEVICRRKIGASGTHELTIFPFHTPGPSLLGLLPGNRDPGGKPRFRVRPGRGADFPVLGHIQSFGIRLRL